MTDPLLAFDKLLGNTLQWFVRSHHSRRLRRIGWERALEPPGGELWAAGDPPPRSGCSLEMLIDGAEALPRLAAELRKARSHVHLAGWFVSPYFALARDPVRVELRTLLAELAECLAQGGVDVGPQLRVGDGRRQGGGCGVERIEDGRLDPLAVRAGLVQDVSD